MLSGVDKPGLPAYYLPSIKEAPYLLEVKDAAKYEYVERLAALKRVKVPI